MTPRLRSRAPQQWVRVLFPLAATVLIALGAILGLWRNQRPVEHPVAYHRLRVSVTADQAYPEAAFSVSLPAGVQLAEEAGLALTRGAQLAWRAALAAGQNTLDLPLQARGDVSGVRVRVRIGAATLEQQLGHRLSFDPHSPMHRLAQTLNPTARSAPHSSSMALALNLEVQP